MKDRTILKASGISKRYGGISALTDVSFDLKEGEILGLCGENGAGKSTLVKIMGGFEKPDTGTLIIADQEITMSGRTDPSLLTIVHQELSVLPHLSVLDNIMIGVRDRSFFYRRGRYLNQVREYLDAVGLDHISPLTLTGELSLAERQLVEIARGLASGARVLLLDEPTATLSEAEISKVFAVMRRLRDEGTTMVIISHRLDEIFALTDRVTVFRSGRHIFTRDTAGLSGAELVTAMLGRELERKVDGPVRECGPAALECRQLGSGNLFGPLDFHCGKGEIVAIAGQLGSGADVLLRTLAGLNPGYQGSLILNGSEADIRSVRDADMNRISYVPEDRAGKGAFLDAAIGHNLTSRALPAVSSHELMSSIAEKSMAHELARSFSLNPDRVNEPVSVLSGGNQQKVVLGKAMATEPDFLLLNEPTRGVDIGARSDIYDRLRQRADNGLSIIFYSTDLEEILDFADRVVTVFKGRIIRNLSRSEASQESILQDILQGTEEAA